LPVRLAFKSSLPAETRWITLLSRFGTMTLRQVIQPALRLAQEGFPIYPTLRENIRSHSQRFHKEWPTTARIFLPNGRIPNVGEVLKQARSMDTPILPELHRVRHEPSSSNRRTNLSQLTFPKLLLPQRLPSRQTSLREQNLPGNCRKTEKKRTPDSFGKWLVQRQSHSRTL